MSDSFWSVPKILSVMPEKAGRRASCNPGPKTDDRDDKYKLLVHDTQAGM